MGARHMFVLQCEQESHPYQGRLIQSLFYFISAAEFIPINVGLIETSIMFYYYSYNVIKSFDIIRYEYLVKQW